MKHLKFNLLLLCAVVATLFSCEKYNVDAFFNKEANSVLNIKTRASVAGETTESKISYPINIYIFYENSCVETTSIESGNSSISLKLPEGNYEVYAIAGADAENYNLPTKDNATKEYLISLKADKTHGDLMTAKNNITLAYGEENTLTLSLERKVMLLENVSIKNVPSNVTAVSVTISPLYENILLNGEYSGENGSQTINLTKGSDGTTWENDVNTYLLEACGQATIKVSLKTDAVTKSYSYTCSDELKANYKINISGTYNENGITLNGTITGATWNGTKNINFNFDESGSTTDVNTDGEVEDEQKEEETNEETDETATGIAPQAGTLYKGCYVLRTEQTGSGTKVTLMSTESKTRLEFTKGDQESMKSSINNGLQELAVDDIENWRLPTLEELKYIKNNINLINENLENLNKKAILYSSGGFSYSYYYMTEDGNISTYSLNLDTITNNPGSGLATYILRGFVTITFTE
ncbi:FimB/Mfa2 family fimbrial subunit [Prevotella sp.]|uniref:FimB/Mfa2 family fimbrial subunit n=1 Tax=Prevotella sp. TaxID=59823 RepID=UPI003AB842EA